MKSRARNQVRPDVALFGEKDWQRLAVIRRMASDLDLSFPTASAILAVPTVREADGVAMSSRNAYLSADQRAQAAALPAAMQRASARLRGGIPISVALAGLAQDLLEGGFTSVDYAELTDADTLAPLDRFGEAPARLLVAAHIGGARLIDSIAV